MACLGHGAYSPSKTWFELGVLLVIVLKKGSFSILESAFLTICSSQVRNIQDVGTAAQGKGSVLRVHVGLVSWLLTATPLLPSHLTT